VLAIGYLAAFWNSESSIGFPAQAMKTVIAPDQISEQDQGSNLYREIENHDITATIRARPITGFGFGHKFLRPVPLPDISGFPFFEYVPHNSILWIWIKAGGAGFVAMLFLFGSAIRQGVHTVVRVRSGTDLVLTFIAAAYLVMYLVFAYVDIAWDTRSMVTVAVAMAICSEYARLASGREPARSTDQHLASAPAGIT
jgi:O-antigen ligase